MLTKLVLVRGMSVLVLSLLWMLVLPPPALSSDVLVMVDETRGQGTLRKRGKECLIITPKHVIEDAFEITLMLPDRSVVYAEVLERYGLDVAVLRADAGAFKNCPDQPFRIEEISDLLENNDRGTLRMRDSDGSAQLVQVIIEGYDTYKTIRILPGKEGQIIQQGFSGSLLYIDRKVVGMLTHVVDGIGVVMQAKTLNSVVDPFFQAADAGNSVIVTTDSTSEFLLPTVRDTASFRAFSIVGNGDDWSYSLTLSTHEETIDSDTDKLHRVITLVNVKDRFGTRLISKELVAIGNSFVDVKTSRINARKAMQSKLNDMDLFAKIK